MDEESLESLAELSTARGCGFAGLAILCTMVGCAFDPSFAFRVGGVLCLSMTFTLALKAHRAPWKSYKETEIWVMLDKHQRPPPTVAQSLIAAARRQAFLHWAEISARVALVMFGGSLLLSFL